MTTTDQSPEAWREKARELSVQACRAFSKWERATGCLFANSTRDKWAIARDELYEHLANHPGARPAVEQAVGWIPVGERLPEGENAVSCEVWCQEESDTQLAGPCVMSFDDGQWYSREDTGCWEPGEITHWRPRSPPPGAQAVQPQSPADDFGIRQPVAWRREWDGDVSDEGHWLYSEDEKEPQDGHKWQPLFMQPPSEQEIREGLALFKQLAADSAVQPENSSKADLPVDGGLPVQEDAPR